MYIPLRKRNTDAFSLELTIILDNLAINHTPTLTLAGFICAPPCVHYIHQIVLTSHVQLNKQNVKHKKLQVNALFLLFGLGGLQAQDAVPTTGGEASGSGGTVHYSIGQVVYTTNNGTSGSVAQGVQQPFEISTISGIDVRNINLELSVFPNPTVDYLSLKVENSELSTFNFQLYDIQGKLVMSKQLSSKSTTIDMKNLPTSTYLLKVTDDQKWIKTFKIIKN